MFDVLSKVIPGEVSEITDYRLENLALMFFIFAFAGFVWEVIYTAATEKVVAKRGMLHGPWIPLYGVGGVLILILLGRFRDNPPLVLVLSMTLCGSMEYITSVIVERIYGERWWDYSAKRVNYHGRVCLSGILLFGVSGTAAVCGFGPVLNENIGRIAFPIHAALVLGLGALFIADMVLSAKRPNRGKGVTYNISTNKDHNDDKTAE